MKTNSSDVYKGIPVRYLGFRPGDKVLDRLLELASNHSLTPRRFLSGAYNAVLVDDVWTLRVPLREDKKSDSGLEIGLRIEIQNWLAGQVPGIPKIKQLDCGALMEQTMPGEMWREIKKGCKRSDSVIVSEAQANLKRSIEALGWTRSDLSSKNTLYDKNTQTVSFVDWDSLKKNKKRY